MASNWRRERSQNFAGPVRNTTAAKDAFRTASTWNINSIPHTPYGKDAKRKFTLQRYNGTISTHKQPAVEGRHIQNREDGNRVNCGKPQKAASERDQLIGKLLNIVTTPSLVRLEYNIKGGKIHAVTTTYTAKEISVIPFIASNFPDHRMTIERDIVKGFWIFSFVSEESAPTDSAKISLPPKDERSTSGDDTCFSEMAIKEQLQRRKEKRSQRRRYFYELRQKTKGIKEPNTSTDSTEEPEAKVTPTQTTTPRKLPACKIEYPRNYSKVPPPADYHANLQYRGIKYSSILLRAAHVVIQCPFNKETFKYCSSSDEEVSTASRLLMDTGARIDDLDGFYKYGLDVLGVTHESISNMEVSSFGQSIRRYHPLCRHTRNRTVSTD